MLVDVQEQETTEDAQQSVPTGVAPNTGSAAHVARDLALYTIARLGMLVVVAAILALVGVPLLVAAAVAVVFVMPLSMLVFGSLRRRVATGIAVRKQERQQRRERLRAQLRGDEVDDQGSTDDQ